MCQWLSWIWQLVEGTLSERQTAFFNVKCSQIAVALLFGKLFSFHNSDPKVVDTLLFGLHFFLAFFWGVVAFFFLGACLCSFPFSFVSASVPSFWFNHFPSFVPTFHWYPFFCCALVGCISLWLVAFDFPPVFLDFVFAQSMGFIDATRNSTASFLGCCYWLLYSIVFGHWSFSCVICWSAPPRCEYVNLLFLGDCCLSLFGRFFVCLYVLFVCFFEGALWLYTGFGFLWFVGLCSYAAKPINRSSPSHRECKTSTRRSHFQLARLSRPKWSLPRLRFFWKVPYFRQGRGQHRPVKGLDR